MNINKNKIFNPYIYCYTTPTIPEHDGWCKIGYTDSETPEECVRSQGLRVSAPTKLEWAKPARFENSEATPFKDHIFHDFLVTVKHVKRKEDPNYKGNKKPEYFNITPDQAREIGNIADGVIVGSAIVKIIEENGENATEALKDYVSSMKKASNE